MTLNPTSFDKVSPSGVLASFLILNVVSGAVGGAMQLLVPLLALKLLASTAEIGLIRGITGFGMLLLVIPAGFLVDHFGARRLFLLGSIVTTALTLLLPYSQVPIHMMILQCILGIFGTLKMTALSASFFDRISGMGLSRVGWFKGSMSIGLTFIGPLFAGWIIGVLPLDKIFQLLAWMTLIPTALVFIFHKDLPKNNDQISMLKGVRSQWQAMRALLADNSLSLPLLTEAVATGCFATFSAFIVPIVVQSLHRSAGVASILISIEGSIFIVTVFLAGKLITRLSALQLYVLSALTTIAALAGLGFADQVFSVGAFACLLGLGLGLFNLVTATRQGLAKGEKGKTVALFTAAVGVGISFGPMLGGQFAEHFGPSTVFFAFVPIFLFLIALAVNESRQLGVASDLVAQESGS